MAYRPIQINPLDLKPSIAIGVSIPFEQSNVFTSVYTTAEQIKYNMINYLLTDKSERIFNVGFGAGLRGELFEQMEPNNLESLEARIGDELRGYFPNVQLTQVKLVPSYDENYLTLRIRYNIENTGKSDEILLNFNNNGI